MICFTGGFQENSNENDKNGKRQILIKKKKINAKRRMKIEKIKLKKNQKPKYLEKYLPFSMSKKINPFYIKDKKWCRAGK